MGYGYTQLSLEERCTIARLHEDGQSLRQIAATMGRSPSSIAREIRRNSGTQVGYRPVYAEERALSRRWRGSRLERNAGLRSEVLERLAQGWSPEQVSGRLAREHGCAVISHESIYRFLYAQIAYQCAWCCHRIHPMAGTIFQDSHIPLWKWFLAIYLFTTSRHGVPAKELQRKLDVSYKTAWRMGHQIRKHMGEVNGFQILSGIVEVDETYIGGKRKGKRGRGAAGKTIVMGLLEKAGSVQTQIIPDIKRDTLHPIIENYVEGGSVLHTDELPSYRTIAQRGYLHKTVNHGAGQYVHNGVHVNGIEGFWSQLKRSIRGTHVSISPQHMDKYLSEFKYRYNMRKKPQEMFPRLVAGF